MSNKIKNILMIEDDYQSMQYLRSYLESNMGWEVVLIAEKELLEKLSTNRYDLILLDLMIRPQSPDSSGKMKINIQYEGINWKQTGLEFLRRFRSGEYSQKDKGTPPDVPIIILSAVAESSVNENPEAGFHNEKYVEKPFRLKDLIEQIHKLLEE
jgi:CheY-like chemotaxis protein